MSNTPTWNSWASARKRCNNPRDSHYAYYGGRGITVCERWDPREGGSFLNFLVDMGERPEGKTLDRKDHNGNYELGNCRWATPMEQRQNQRCTCGCEHCCDRGTED